MEAASWFSEVHAIADSLPVHELRCLEVGGGVIELVAASPAVAAVALDGVVEPRSELGAGRPVARWVAIDGSTTHLPPPPFGAADVMPRDGVRGFASGRFRLAWAIERQVLWGLDVEDGAGFLWMRDPARCAVWDRSAPWRPHLAWWLGVHDAGLVHAAAVTPPGRPGAGVLLVGRGGSGKSTLALACGAAGWDVTADDYVVVHRAAHRWTATAPYRWAKVAPASIDLLGIPASWLVPGIDHLGKSLIDLPSALGSKGAAPTQLTAIVAPRIVRGARGPVRPLHASAVVAALGPSTVLQTPGDSAEGLRTVAAVASSLPGWSLDVDHEVGRAGPPALLEVIDRAMETP